MAAVAGVIRWGIIGCGDVTEKKSGPGLQRATGSKLVAVMRRDGSKARDYAERHGVPRWYDSVEALLADSEVDAVYVATPPGSHLELAHQVAAAGKPCYMEKPMARNLKDSAAMQGEFERAGLPLFVAYYRRAYPRFLKIKEILESGCLGQLSSVSYVLRKRPLPEGGSAGWRSEVTTSGGGLFVDVGSHLLDALDFLLGPLCQVQGAACRLPSAPPSAPEDSVSMSFVAGAAAGTCQWNFRAADDFEHLEFVGTSGRLLVPDALNGTLITFEPAGSGEPQSWKVEPPAPAVQEPLIQTVVNALLAKDPSQCPSTASSAVRTAAYMDAILTGFYGNRKCQFWDKPETWAVNLSPKC